MLTLTRKTEYAVVAMVDLAGRGSARVSAREIAERTHVPLPMLTNVLHQLLRHGLVTSKLGSKGGYRLAKTPEEVTFRDMIDAIEGPFKLTACCPANGESQDRGGQCYRADRCTISTSMRRVHDGLQGMLDRVTLAQVVSGELPAGPGLKAGRKKHNGRPRAAQP